VNWKASLAFIKNETLFKVTGSHLHRKSGSIKEMAQDRHVVTTHVVTTLSISHGLSIRTISSDLNDLKDECCTAFQMQFDEFCATLRTVSTDTSHTTRRAVHQR